MKNASSIAMVYSGMTAPVLAELERRGLDTDPIMAAARLSFEDLERQFIPAAKAWDFLEYASEAAKDTTLGYSIGIETPSPKLPNLSVLEPTEVTLGERLSKLVVDAARLTNQATYDLSHDSQFALLRQTRNFRPARHPKQAEGFFAGFIVKLLNETQGADWAPGQFQISLKDAAVLPNSVRAMVPVVTGRSTGMLFRFPAPWLLIGKGGRENRNVAVDAVPGFDLIEGVRAELNRRLSDPSLSLAEVASVFAVTPRFLQSELAMIGTNFRTELASCRRKRAACLLQTTDLSASEIGAAIGLPNPSVFSRSFKKWAGVSPDAFRRKTQE